MIGDQKLDIFKKLKFVRKFRMLAPSIVEIMYVFQHKMDKLRQITIEIFTLFILKIIAH